MKLTRVGLIACACLTAAAASIHPSHATSPVIETGEPRILFTQPSALSLARLLEAARRHSHVASPSQLRGFETSRGFKIVVHKSRNLLYLFHGTNVNRVFKIARSVFDANKRRSGDRRTPEGLFSSGQPVNETQKGWHVWMVLNAGDRAKRDYITSHGEAGKKAIAAFEKKHGAISTDAHVRRFNSSHALVGKPMWFGLGIHGGGNESHWTHGCIALDSGEAIQLQRTLAASPSRGRNTPVLIIP